LRGYLAQGGKKGKGSAEGIDERIDSNGLQRTVGTLCADTHPGAYSGQDAYTGRLIPYRKSKRAQSDKDDETWVEDGKANTINVFDSGDTRTTHAVVEPIAIQATIIGRGDNSGPQGVGAKEGGPMFTLTKADIHGVAYPIISPTVTTCKGSRGGCSSEAIDEISAIHKAQVDPVHFDTYNQAVSDKSMTLSCSASDANHTGTVFVPNMAVRRLTPEECEALQGFPKGFTKIPWKGAPADECPDGHRYKACGNSMAVPVMAWIGKRIAEYEARQK
jgi:DNA (cytosine-5)-methyltransferase 1